MNEENNSETNNAIPIDKIPKYGTKQKLKNNVVNNRVIVIDSIGLIKLIP